MLQVKLCLLSGFRLGEGLLLEVGLELVLELRFPAVVLQALGEVLYDVGVLLLLLLVRI